MTSKLYIPDRDITIVLGAGISPEGKLPAWVIRRLNRGSELYSEKPETNILLSGKGKDEYPITEAKTMANYLVKSGVPREAVYLEELSEDTIQNAYFSRVIHTDPMGVRKPLIVTNKFQEQRADELFKWILGNDYNPRIETVPDEDLNPEALQKRMDLESKLNDFNEKAVFPKIRKGNLADLHDFIFDPENMPGRDYKEFLATLDLTPGYGRK